MNTPKIAAHSMRFISGFADTLCSGIPADRFARMPEGVETNHPAFVLSHLLIYPDKAILPFIGKPELAQDFAAYEAVAAPGTDCRDDPDGSIYAGKNELLAKHAERCAAAADALEDVDESIFAQPNPIEGFRDRMPTVGDAVMFLCGGHGAFHLGQVSGWRRSMGLGSAM